MYHYVYYSYEEWDRGYIGRRKSSCVPEEDSDYFGSFSDPLFKPNQKIILGVFNSLEEASEAEVLLHNFFKVDKNPHFANVAKQGSKKFYYDCTGKENPGSSAKRRELNLTDNPMKRPETVRKLKEKINSPECRERKIKALKISRNTPESRRKSKEASLRQWAEPGVKESFSERRKGKGNPCHGRKWVTNGEDNIYLGQFDEIPCGYQPGRTVKKKFTLES
jgi:hypothetical protein